MRLILQLGIFILVLLGIAVFQVAITTPYAGKLFSKLQALEVQQHILKDPTTLHPLPTYPPLHYRDNSDKTQFSEIDYYDQSNDTRPILETITYGRLGYQIFQYAVSYCVALQTHRTPSIGRNSRLLTIFPHISAKKLKRSMHIDSLEKINTSLMVSEPAWSIYNRDIIKQVKRSNQTFLKGCFHSWKYFAGCERALRREFTFNSTMQGEVYTNMRVFAKHYMIAKGIQYHDITFVSIHVRLGDMLDPENIKFGFTTAPISYINNAMDYYNQKYKWPLFIAASEDIHWCKDNIKPPQNNVYFSPYGEEEFLYDFTLLSSCNHSVTTIGSYGWFAAWLAGGECVYYDQFPIPGSALLRGVSFEDRYPPTWIGMS